MDTEKMTSKIKIRYRRLHGALHGGREQKKAAEAKVLRDLRLLLYLKFYSAEMI
jgi:hypothetical protein